MTRDKLQKFINKSAWFHRIDLGDGIITPGLQDCAKTLDRVGIPEDLTGKNVLDIGANDGYFSFAAERRGAAHVVALDLWNRKYDNTRAVENIHVCKEVLNSNIEIVQMDFLEYIPKYEFDLILFMGVFYHMKNPISGIEKLMEIGCKDLILESHFIGGEDYIMKFYSGSQLNNDPTNWWGATKNCLVDMVSVSGFNDIHVHNVSDDRITIHARGKE